MSHSRVALAVAASLLALALCTPGALASGPGPKKALPTLTLSVAARPRHPAVLRLVARLQRRSGASRGSVAFFVVSTEFGQPRDVPIGTAETAANGAASISYAPTWKGREQFVARLKRPGADVLTATASYRVTVSTPGRLSGLANPRRPLADVGGVFLDAILTAVALVWLSLIAVLAVVFGWLPRLAGEGID